MIFLLLFLAHTHAQWKILDKSSPTHLTSDPDAQIPPSSLASVWCTANNNMIVYTKKQVWKFETSDQRWLWQPDPIAIVPENEGGAYWSIRGKYFLFKDQLTYYDTGTRDFVLETPLVKGGPVGACTNTAFWTHEATNRLYFWGGTCGNGNATNTQIWAYDIVLRQWLAVNTKNTGPTPADSGAACLSGNENTVYIYTRDQMWLLDLTSFEWKQTINANAPPGPLRIHMQLWKSSKDSSIILFGGMSGSKVYGDTWIYSPELDKWQFKDLSGPLPRWGASSCLDSNGYLLMYGGGDLESSFNDVWQYGPFNVQNIFDKLQWQLDSATLMSTWAAATSSATLFLILVLLIVFCVRKWLFKRQQRKFGTFINASPLISNNHNNQNNMDEL
jgi:hypothetical protein